MDEEMKRELNGIKSELARISQAVSGLADSLAKQGETLAKQGETLVKQGETLAKQGTEMKAGFTRMDAEFERSWRALNRVAATATRTESRLTDLENYVHRNVVTRKEFDARFDQFGAFVEAARKDRKSASDAYMQLADRLDSHDKRLGRLESRRA